MFKFLGKLLVIVKGWFINTGDDLVSSGPSTIKSTYASAIAEATKRYQEMKQGLGMIIQQKTRLQNQHDKIDEELEKLHIKLDGAIQAAEHDADDTQARKDGQRFLSRIKELEEKKKSTISQIEGMVGKLVEYKNRLSEMHAEVDKLKVERGEMVAEFMTAQHALRLEEQLSGLPTESSIDEAVVAIREKVENMKAQVQVASEMRGASTVEGDKRYEELGEFSRTETQFDELLRARAATPKIQAAAPQRQLLTEEPEVERALG